MIRRSARPLLLLALLCAAPHARAEPPPAKLGRFLLDVDTGPSFSITGPYYSLWYDVGIDFGVAVTPDHNGYILFSPQLQIGSDVEQLLLSLGFQYDVRLPVRGLYLTPRLLAGYAPIFFSNLKTAGIFDLGFIEPAIGIKYVLRGRWSFGLTPFSLPIFFGASPSERVVVNYRLLASAGVCF
ncbi:MAG: hypothetical protein ACHQ17_14025 [Polyangia bacterium]